jgi:hypothetical protein
MLAEEKVTKVTHLHSFYICYFLLYGQSLVVARSFYSGIRTSLPLR